MFINHDRIFETQIVLIVILCNKEWISTTICHRVSSLWIYGCSFCPQAVNLVTLSTIGHNHFIWTFVNKDLIIKFLDVIQICLEVSAFGYTCQALIETTLLTFEHDMVTILRNIYHNKLIVALETLTRLILAVFTWSKVNINRVCKTSYTLVPSIVREYGTHIGDYFPCRSVLPFCVIRGFILHYSINRTIAIETVHNKVTHTSNEILVVSIGIILHHPTTLAVGETGRVFATNRVEALSC